MSLHLSLALAVAVLCALYVAGAAPTAHTAAERVATLTSTPPPAVLLQRAFAQGSSALTALVTRHSRVWRAFHARFRAAHPEGVFPIETYLRMRDGTFLFTAYWAPENTPRPTVVIRSPYGPLLTENLADAYLPFGFNVVMQNMRATGLSEGHWTMMDGCWFDGNDTMAWIAQQPWSNGEVFQVGASADGFLTYFDMKINQPFMKSQFLIFSSDIPYLTCYENGGAFKVNLATEWLEVMHIWRPLSPSYLTDVLDHEGFSDYWLPRTMTNFSNIDFPAVHVGGWYDIFSGTMIKSFNDYQNLAGPNARHHQKLVMGPRGHCMVIKGDWDFYFPEGHFDIVWSFEASIDTFRSVSKAEFDHELFHAHADAPKMDTYTFYVMGSDEITLTSGDASDTVANAGGYWTTLPAWPTPSNVTLYLSPEWTLSSAMPSPTKASYVYNPRNPVPTVCGDNLFLSCGPCDQTSVESRDDVLLFTTASFAKPVTVFGSIDVVLYVSSNCTDTDFTVKVTDVYPNGNSIIVVDTMIRMRWRDGAWEDAKPVLMQPGEVYEVKFNLWPTAQVFNPGHRLRVAVSSSNYPRFSASPNNGKLVREGGALHVAENIVYFGKTTPSRVVLPTVSLDQIPNNIKPFA